VEGYCVVREQSSHVYSWCRHIVFLLQIREKKRFSWQKTCVSSDQKLPTRSATDVELGDISRSRAGFRIAVGNRKNAPHRPSDFHRIAAFLVKIFPSEVSAADAVELFARRAAPRQIR
jgi:hypothetical protein